MSDRKHKHKSKDSKKDRDYDRHHKKKKRNRSRSRSQSRSRSRNRDSHVAKAKVRNRSKSREIGHSSRYDEHRELRDYSHSRRSRTPQREYYYASDNSPSPDRKNDIADDNTTNLVNFTFLDYKSELSKVLTGYMLRDKLVDDVADFWLFLQKYETTLRNSGQSILPDPLDDVPDESESRAYNRAFNINLKLAIPFDDLYGRISAYVQSTKLPKRKVKQFLQIVVNYLEFRQKERFMILRKLRQTQAELPVAKYKDDIIAAVANEQVVLVAGDTGCGKSTQIPQYLRQAGYEAICCTQPRKIYHKMVFKFKNI